MDIGKGHITGKCPCGVYHGRRRYPQPMPEPTTAQREDWIAHAAEAIAQLRGIIQPTYDEYNDWTVVARAMDPITHNPKGDDLV
jgi:hypothetical protein